jgi:hypothetical protein
MEEIAWTIWDATKMSALMRAMVATRPDGVLDVVAYPAMVWPGPQGVFVPVDKSSFAGPLKAVTTEIAELSKLRPTGRERKGEEKEGEATLAQLLEPRVQMALAAAEVARRQEERPEASRFIVEMKGNKNAEGTRRYLQQLRDKVTSECTRREGLRSLEEEDEDGGTVSEAEAQLWKRYENTGLLQVAREMGISSRFSPLCETLSRQIALLEQR